ncbi:MAG: hypothetical protein ABI678_24055 [Kofleriaceae bacterium]
MIHVFAFGATACGVALMLAPRTAQADPHHRRCEIVDGKLAEDPAGAANCPTGHPGCFRGEIHGRGLHAATLFYGDGAGTPPVNSPDFIPYTGITTYTTNHGSFVTRESGHYSTVEIAEAPEGGDGASFSIEIITSGTGEFANATGYLYVTGFVNNASHVSSTVTGKICTP